MIAHTLLRGPGRVVPGGSRSSSSRSVAVCRRPLAAGRTDAVIVEVSGAAIDEPGHLDYVSCSPFRVPLARLAAAQAALAEQGASYVAAGG